MCANEEETVPNRELTEEQPSSSSHRRPQAHTGTPSKASLQSLSHPPGRGCWSLCPGRDSGEITAQRQELHQTPEGLKLPLNRVTAKAMLAQGGQARRERDIPSLGRVSQECWTVSSRHCPAATHSFPSRRLQSVPPFSPARRVPFQASQDWDLLQLRPM